MTFRITSRRGFDKFYRKTNYPLAVQNTRPANLIQFLRMNETSGSTALDSSGNGRTGTYTNVTINNSTFKDGSPVPFWNGSQGTLNAFSASLSGAYNLGSVTWMMWCKVANAAVWTDSTYNYLVNCRNNNDNFFEVYQASVNDRITFGVELGNVSETNISSIALAGTIEWFHVAYVISTSENATRAYLNGVQVGTQTGLGTPAASLASYHLGSNSGANLFWNGWLCNAAMWNVALTPEEITYLSIV